MSCFVPLRGLENAFPSFRAFSAINEKSSGLAPIALMDDGIPTALHTFHASRRLTFGSLHGGQAGVVTHDPGQFGEPIWAAIRLYSSTVVSSNAQQTPCGASY